MKEGRREKNEGKRRKKGRKLEGAARGEIRENRKAKKR